MVTFHAGDHLMKISSFFAAALALAPTLLHAAPASSAAAAPTATTGSSLRVSTGVVPPRLVYKVGITSGMDWQWSASGPMRTAQVSLTVDAAGHPTNLKIVKSAGADIDENILTAVNQYRFQPATVDSQAEPMDVDLTLDIVRPAGW
jgi:TonB family protein